MRVVGTREEILEQLDAFTEKYQQAQQAGADYQAAINQIAAIKNTATYPDVTADAIASDATGLAQIANQYDTTIKENKTKRQQAETHLNEAREYREQAAQLRAKDQESPNILAIILSTILALTANAGLVLIARTSASGAAILLYIIGTIVLAILALAFTTSAITKSRIAAGILMIAYLAMGVYAYFEFNHSGFFGTILWIIIMAYPVIGAFICFFELITGPTPAKDEEGRTADDLEGRAQELENQAAALTNGATTQDDTVLADEAARLRAEASRLHELEDAARELARNTAIVNLQHETSNLETQWDTHLAAVTQAARQCGLYDEDDWPLAGELRRLIFSSRATTISEALNLLDTKDYREQVLAQLDQSRMIQLSQLQQLQETAQANAAYYESALTQAKATWEETIRIGNLTEYISTLNEDLVGQVRESNRIAREQAAIMESHARTQAALAGAQLGTQVAVGGVLSRAANVFLERYK